MRLLILGGTTEASALARQIAGRTDLEPVLSLAGRTQSPTQPPIPFRIGGFGGVKGLKATLTERGFDAVIDATHPFAAQMSRHAAVACRELGMPLAVFTRPCWREQDGDRWVRVPDMAGAVHVLGKTPRRVFLTVGGLQLADFAAAPGHHYVVRAIDPPAAFGLLPSGRLILARGPFSIDDEIDLMQAERIDVLVTKDSGGAATEAKLTAARTLGIEVVMIDRPAGQNATTLHSLAATLGWIDAHRPVPPAR